MNLYFNVNWSSNAKTMTNYALAGAIFGSIFPVLICVGVISCCVALCCWCHKKCRNRRQQNVVTVSSVVYAPPPVPSGGYQPSYPHYQPVPLSPGYSSTPIPTAPPPSYQEATDPGYFPLNSMYYLPQQTDGNTQQPFNPAYCPPRYDHK